MGVLSQCALGAYLNFYSGKNSATRARLRVCHAYACGSRAERVFPALGKRTHLLEQRKGSTLSTHFSQPCLVILSVITLP